MLIKEIITEQEFNIVKQRGKGFIAITDGNKSKIHNINCPNVDTYYFQIKVVKNKRKNGNYYWSDNTESLKNKLESMDECLHCKHLF